MCSGLQKRNTKYLLRESRGWFYSVPPYLVCAQDAKLQAALDSLFPPLYLGLVSPVARVLWCG